MQDGEGVILVESVGVNTAYGRLADELANQEERDSPLQHKLSVFASFLTFLRSQAQVLADQIAKLAYFGAFLISLSFLFKQYVIDQNWSLRSPSLFPLLITSLSVPRMRTSLENPSWLSRMRSLLSLSLSSS